MSDFSLKLDEYVQLIIEESIQIEEPAIHPQEPTVLEYVDYMLGNTNLFRGIDFNKDPDKQIVDIFN